MSTLKTSKNEYSYSTTRPTKLNKKSDKNSNNSKIFGQKLFSKNDISSIGGSQANLDESITNSIESLQVKKSKKNALETESANKESINIEIDNVTESERNLYLKSKLKEMNVSENLTKGVVKGIKRTQDEIKDDMTMNKLTISNSILNVSKLMPGVNQNQSKIFLTCTDKVMNKKNAKQIKMLKKQKNIIKENINKLEMNKAILEESTPLKENLIDNNIRKQDLKEIENKKSKLLVKLDVINKQIESIIEKNERKGDKKEKINKFLEGIIEKEEEYAKKVEKYEKEEGLIRAKFQKDKEKTSKKRIEKLEKEEKSKIAKKEKFFLNVKNKEKEVFLKRKKEIDLKMEKTKMHINDKVDKSESDYLYFKKLKKYEEEEQKLRSRILLQHKENLVTKEDIRDLADRVKEHQENMKEEEEKKRRQLREMWRDRNQLLPKYRSPALMVAEEEKERKREEEEKNKQMKELLVKEKQNYKPPNVKIDEKLKEERENKKLKEDKNSIKLTEEKNKKLIENSYKVPKIMKRRKNKSIDEIEPMKYLSSNYNLGYLDNNKLEKLLLKKPKKILKPIQILHPKPEKPIDYLKELRQRSSSSNSGNSSKRYALKINLEESSNNADKNSMGLKKDNIIENIAMAKLKTEAYDRKLNQKREFLQINGGYAKNPTLGDEMGDMLIESIQAKLKIMNKLNNQE